MKKLIFGLLAVVIVLAAICGQPFAWFSASAPENVHAYGFQARYFKPEQGMDRTTVVILGGGEYGDFWAAEFAKAGFVGLSLPYHRAEGLPSLIEEIPLEYFQKAFDWLALQPEVDPSRLIVMGASIHSELALLLAATLPEKVKGVIAQCPSAVCWSNTVMPWSSDEIMSKWTYKGQSLPYLSMQKIEGGPTTQIETLPYWEAGLNDTIQVDRAMIAVEQIAGPILLITPEDDHVWPSLRMSNMIMKRLEYHNFPYVHENLIYQNAGHMITAQYSKVLTAGKGQMKIGEKVYEYAYGGTPAGNLAGQIQSRKDIMSFVENR